MVEHLHTHTLLSLGPMTTLSYCEARRTGSIPALKNDAEGGRADGEECLWWPPCAAHFTHPSWIHSITLRCLMRMLRLRSHGCQWEPRFHLDLRLQSQSWWLLCSMEVSMDANHFGGQFDKNLKKLNTYIAFWLSNYIFRSSPNVFTGTNL